MGPISLHHPITRTFLPCFFSVVVIVIAISTELNAVRAPPPVEINKCCRIGETLDRNQQCSIGGATDQWWPTIYLIFKQAYFPNRGQAPRFMRAREYKRPNCQQPELYSSTNFALFSNGSLFLGERGSFFDVSDYCIDKDVALVCLPGSNGADSLKISMKLTKIRKCCSLNSLYLTEAQTCVPHTENGPIPQNLFEVKNTSHIDLVYGFPSCSPLTNNKYVIADQFQETNLNVADGTYVLQNTKKVLTNDEFCIDHINQNSNIFTGTVFACDELVSVKEAPELKNEEVCQCEHSYRLWLIECFSSKIESPVSHLFDRVNYFCDIFITYIDDWISIALKSSCVALQMPNLLCGMFIDR